MLMIINKYLKSQWDLSDTSVQCSQPATITGTERWSIVKPVLMYKVYLFDAIPLLLESTGNDFMCYLNYKQPETDLI